jgi:hypothetical protein
MYRPSIVLIGCHLHAELCNSLACGVGKLEASLHNSELGQAGNLPRKPRGDQHLPLIASTNQPVYSCVANVR